MPIKQTAQQIAAQVAKQTIHESNEFLKSAREQIAPSVQPQQSEKPQEKKEDYKVDEERFKAESKRLMQTYESELNQIRRDNLFKDLQRKVSEGEDISLESYQNELSFEQKDVLKAQMEIVQNQRKMVASQEKSSPLQVIAKKGRNAMMGMFKKKNEQHVEMRQPPSG